MEWKNNKSNNVSLTRPYTLRYLNRYYFSSVHRRQCCPQFTQKGFQVKHKMNLSCEFWIQLLSSTNICHSKCIFDANEPLYCLAPELDRSSHFLSANQSNAFLGGNVLLSLPRFLAAITTERNYLFRLDIHVRVLFNFKWARQLTDLKEHHKL